MVNSEVGDRLETCPRCGLEIKTSQDQGLEAHIITTCAARSQAVSRAVSRIINMTDKSDLQPLDVLKMEIESVVAQFEDIQNGAAYNLLALSKMNDQQYCSLPDNFSRDFLLKVPERFPPNSDCVELLQQFDLWSQYVDRVAGPDDVQHIIAQYEDIVSSSSGELLTWKEETETDNLCSKVYFYEAQYLSRLEAEIGGLGGVSACPRELESLVTRLQQEMEL